MTVRTGYYSEPQTFTSTLDAFEALIGRRPEIYMWYVSFSSVFPLANVQAVAARGQIPILSWMPDVTGGGNPSTNANIIAGTWDAYLDTFATAVKNYAGPVWLRLGFEMNGTWFQWGNTSFVGMWARVQDRFRAQAVTNVTWVWSPNVVFSGSIPLASVFPGVSRVDVVGLDGYNWGAPTTAGHSADWQPFADVFGESIAQVRALAPDKPFWITEMSSSELGGNKAAWITDAFAQVRYYGLDGWVWFDASKVGEPDFRVNSSAAALAAFQAGDLFTQPPPRWSVMSAAIPLAVRLSTRRADRHITRELASLRFRDTVPGGFASCSLELQRPLDVGSPELAQYGRVYVYDGRTGEVVWEGYQDNPAGSANDAGEVVAVTATGPSSRTRDKQVPLIYCDTDYNRWREQGIASGRLTNALETGGGSIVNQHLVPRGVIAATNTCIVDAWYTAIADAGQKVARVEFRWDCGITDVGWQLRMFIGSTIAYTASANTSGSGSPAIAATVITDFPNDGSNINAVCRWQRVGITGAVGDDDTWARFGTPLRIRAMTLTAAGVEKTTGYTNTYVLSSEVVADLLGRLLSTYAGAVARIDTTSYLIDQLAYPDSTTAADVLEDLMVLDPAYYWAAWEGVDPFGGKSRFEWRTWPTAIRYELGVVDGYDPRAAGADLYDRVRVRYTDSRRRTRTVVRTQIVQSLLDAGVSREGFLDLGSEIGSDANAIQAGDGFLADHAFVPNAGTLTVARPVLDLQTGRMIPPYLIRPGYLARVRGVAPTPDTLNGSARDGSTIFRIAAKDYDTTTAAATLELDTYPRSVAQAIARTRTALARTRRL